MTTADDLRHIATHWDDLRDMLTIPAITGGLGQGLRAYLTAEQEDDRDQLAATERAERTAIALGERPVPLRLSVLDTIQHVEAALLDLADQSAQLEPADIPDAERWRYNASWRHGAPWACMWLAGALAWLPARNLDHVTATTRILRRRVDQALGIAQREDPIPRECFCGGRLVLRHGGPDIPAVLCRGCGTIWPGGAMEVLLREAA